MFSKYIWQNGKFKKFADATVHVLSHSLHYGNAVFEGIRFYNTQNGPSIFKLQQHIDRLFYSSRSIGLNLNYKSEQITEIIKELIKINQLKSGYIRPIVYFGQDSLGIPIKKNPTEMAISCWDFGDYLDKFIDVKVSKYISNYYKSSILDAKFSGHYLNSVLASLEIKGTKYHEALFIDIDGNISEGPGENIFMVKDNIILTPKKLGILPGLTRETVFNLADRAGYKLKEENLKLKDLYSSDEAFFTGTAAEITPIRSVDDHVLGNGDIGPISSFMIKSYNRVTHGLDDDFKKDLTFVI